MLTLVNSDSMANLTGIANEHRVMLQACLKWQAKSGRAVLAHATAAFRTFFDPLNEAITLNMVWLSGEPDPRAWQAMIREVNRFWWEWYDLIVSPSPTPLPFECVNWLPRPDEFEANLKNRRAKVLGQKILAAG